MNAPPIEIYHQYQTSFDIYLKLLLKWNEKINLTAIVAPKDIRERHFLDSLAILLLDEFQPPPNVPRGTFLKTISLSMFDIGAGAGFPGIPLKIVCPQLKLTLVDSVKKKCDFMKEVIRQLNLKEVTVLHQTLSESKGVGIFDLIVSRAVFSLKDYLKVALPNLKCPDGSIVAMKSFEIDEELEACQQTLANLSLKIKKEMQYTLSTVDTSRKILIFKKN